MAPAEVTIIRVSRMGDEGEAEEAGETNSQSPVFSFFPSRRLLFCRRCVFERWRSALTHLFMGWELWGRRRILLGPPSDGKLIFLLQLFKRQSQGSKKGGPGG